MTITAKKEIVVFRGAKEGVSGVVRSILDGYTTTDVVSPLDRPFITNDGDAQIFSRISFTVGNNTRELTRDNDGRIAALTKDKLGIGYFDAEQQWQEVVFTGHQIKKADIRASNERWRETTFSWKKDWIPSIFDRGRRK